MEGMNTERRITSDNFILKFDIISTERDQRFRFSLHRRRSRGSELKMKEKGERERVKVTYNVFGMGPRFSAQHSIYSWIISLVLTSLTVCDDSN